MRFDSRQPLSSWTTLGLGGPADSVIEVNNVAEIVEVVEGVPAYEPLLLLAGGSNVVISDVGFDGTVVLLRSRGLQINSADERVEITVAAGHPFDELVGQCVAEGLAGLECLSGIPGSTGATPIQNVGAYGQEVAETISAVRVYDRTIGKVITLTPQQCGFAYRHSVFKRNPRYIVLEVVFVLHRASVGGPLRYGELSRRLEIPAGGKASLPQIRATVLELRRGKGMVIDPADPDSRSVGSFFTNPVLNPETWKQLQNKASVDEMPHWAQPNGTVKLPAAWLIERAGFTKGYGHDGVAISSKHTLALTNRGTGSTTALLALAREIRDGVYKEFGVELVPEPVLVGEQF